MRIAALAVAVLLCATRTGAQDFDGHFSTLFVVMPDASGAAGHQTVAESRSRLFAEGLFNPTDAVHVRAGVFVDTLLAHRQPFGAAAFTGDAVMRPADLYIEYRGASFDLRAGMSRVVWGRLDEIQPTDVVNPLDLSRFLLEGRSEARLPVALVRGRAFLPRGTTLEAILVPAFRAGRFDQLDEPTSPFLLVPPGLLGHEPDLAIGNLQGGARLTSTAGRVDWGASAWRGFESFPAAVAVYPRFTMIGADFETVHGAWGVRGEAAWFDTSLPGRFEGGIGADRRAGHYRVALNAVVSHADDTDVTLVGWGERTFARETRSVRLLGVYDPADATAFVRGIGAVSFRDNLWLEASAGWLTGEADAAAPRTGDILGLLSHRDFLYLRLRVHF
jgi:hypothetical protein